MLQQLYQAHVCVRHTEYGRKDLQVSEVGQCDSRWLISARWQDLSFQADVKGMPVCFLKIRQGLRSLTWCRTPALAPLRQQFVTMLQSPGITVPEWQHCVTHKLL